MKQLTLLLIGHRGCMGRLHFLVVEVVRLVLLAGCYGLYRMGWLVAAATFLPLALWPGIVGTIKRFRDLGRDPILILPVLMYLAAGFTLAHVLALPVVAVVTLFLYLSYVLGFPSVHGKTDTLHTRS